MRKPKPVGHTEYHIKQEVKQILDDTGWIYWMPAANAFGRSGQSDFLAVKSCMLFMAIETKYKDVVTALQFKFLSDIHNTGHDAFLVDETNIEVLRAVLRRGNASEKSRQPLLKWQDQNRLENLTDT
jgi:hypothetical protein